MKHLLFSILLFFGLQISFAQQWEIEYQSQSMEQAPIKNSILLVATPEVSLITKPSRKQTEAQYPFERQYLSKGKIISEAHLSTGKKIYTIDSLSSSKQPFTFHDETKIIAGIRCKKATTSINSNHIVLWYTQDLPIKGGPTSLGNFLGLILEYEINSSRKITATTVRKSKKITLENPFTKTITFESPIDYRDSIWKSKFTTLPVFKNAQVNFDKGNVTNDSILKFANGTVLLKKIKLPKLSLEHQLFVDARVKSNGDAYDRTGSIFIIDPTDKHNFLHGLENGANTLPIYTIETGEKYQGIIRTENYVPTTELMRFFTTFGVSHFNKIQLKDKDWYEWADYRQDITELSPMLSDKEVYVGVFIGNYDKGGHIVDVNLTIHNQGMNVFKNTKAITLFNTTNIMEMAGQNYATLFKDKEGLKMKFYLEEGMKNAHLRYTVTGHGGWGNGDEFVPKTSTIAINNNQTQVVLPWRVDCGSYRLFNPASGNFDNGLSSSDLSRSNWCPGTMTNPFYIPLKDLEAGWHIIQVTIPQGEPEGGSFSAWNVSGVLIGN